MQGAWVWSLVELTKILYAAQHDQKLKKKKRGCKAPTLGIKAEDQKPKDTSAPKTDAKLDRADQIKKCAVFKEKRIHTTSVFALRYLSKYNIF